MQSLVQSAIDAANSGDNNKALELCKQALAANPNDVDAWLVVAAVVDQPERKRQCLNRVLALDPTNQIARDELLDMDRLTMGDASLSAPETAADTPQDSTPPHTTYPTSPSAFEVGHASELEYPSSFSSIDPGGTSTFESALPPQSPEPVASPIPEKAIHQASSKARAEKPLVFKYPLYCSVFFYSIVIIAGCGGLYVMTKNWQGGLILLVPALLLAITATGLWTKVEVSKGGIRVVGILNSPGTRWSDIQSIKKSGWWEENLQLLKSNGKVINIPAQISDYRHLVEILQEKRPDLFGIVSAGPSSAFSGTKTFKKGFAKQYGLPLFYIPLLLIAMWIAISSPGYRVRALTIAAGGAVVTVLITVASLVQVGMVRLEPNKLTIGTAFEEKIFSARQIRDIKMQTVRERYGTLVGMVKVITVQGRIYSLNGFPEDNEIIHGFLRNWWNTYKDKQPEGNP